MTDLVASWQRFTSRRARIQWQRDFFDHRLRGDEGWREKVRLYFAESCSCRTGEQPGRLALCPACGILVRIASGRDASPRRPKHPLKANSWDGSESHPYQLEANVSARAPCRFPPRACAVRRPGSRFLPPFARATCAGACSADNQRARCVSPGRHAWRAGSIF
jgi:hypothetical protein